MDQELKQRLIGAVVVTALAAIFIPMLFDDPIDDRSQQVSELAIPVTPPVPSGEAAIDKAPENSDQTLNTGNPEEGFVEDPNGAEEEPMQPIEGPDADEENGLSAAAKPVVKEKDKAKAKKTKPSVDDVVIPPVPMDEESDEKIDAEVAKLRPKSTVKREPAKLALDNTVKHTDQIVKAPAADDKLVNIEKLPVVKKPVPDAESTKPKPVTKSVVAEKPLDTNNKTAASDPAKQAAAPKPPAKPKKWVIQVGSFGKKENAVSLSESLRKDGFPVSVDTVQGEKGPIYRLKIGPELDAKRASDMKARLDKQNVKSMLIAE